MSLFFVGLNPRWQMYKFLPYGVNVMYSAAGAWDETKRKWRPIRFPKQANLRWLDMGGFTALNRWGDYPFTIGNALNLVALIAPNFYSTLDYPCEPDIARKAVLQTNVERIEATVQNAVEMACWECLVPSATMVPVIQGYTLEEYCRCIDLYAAKGLVRPYMAVGSMCRQLSNQELHALIPGIYAYACKAGCEYLHFFGLKLSPALRDLSRYIWSRDSAVALDAYDAEIRTCQGGRRWPRGQEEKAVRFEAFRRRVWAMGLQFEGDSLVPIGNVPSDLLDLFDPGVVYDDKHTGFIDTGTMAHLQEMMIWDNPSPNLG